MLAVSAFSTATAAKSNLSEASPSPRFGTCELNDQPSRCPGAAPAYGNGFEDPVLSSNGSAFTEGTGTLSIQSFGTEADYQVGLFQCNDGLNGDPNTYSIQLNTNFFSGSNGDVDWVQFVAQSEGNGVPYLAIWEVDLTQNVYSPFGFNVTSWPSLAKGTTLQITGEATTAGVLEIFAYADGKLVGSGVAPNEFMPEGAWTSIEFNVYGLGCGDEAVFSGANDFLVNDTGVCLSACTPSTSLGGLTGETSNLVAGTMLSGRLSADSIDGLFADYGGHSTTVAGLDDPIALAFDPVNGYTYVANEGNDTVGVVNSRTNALVESIQTGPSPDGVAYDSSNGEVYVANGNSDSVAVIRASTGALVANITVGYGPQGVAFDPANGDLYVADTGSGSLSVIDGRTNAVIQTVGVGPGPTGVAYDSTNGDLYVSDNASDSVTVMDASTYALLANVSVGASPQGLAFDPSNGDVYVADSGSNSTSVISGANDTVLATIGVGYLPEGVAFDAADQMVYVSNTLSDSVSAISSSTAQVVASSPTGPFPFGLAVDTSNGEVFVANWGSGTVSVVGAPVAVQCAETSVGVGAPVSCTATVGSGQVLTGTIAWSASAPGKFSSPSCTLKLGSCTVRFAPGSVGPLIDILADYNPAKGSAASFGSSTISATKGVTSVRVTCGSLTVKVGRTLKCSAIVSGYEPTGEVTWSSSGSGGGASSFKSNVSSCTLALGRCSVTITGAAAGSVTLQASYSGNQNDLQSSGSLSITIKS